MNPCILCASPVVDGTDYCYVHLPDTTHEDLLGDDEFDPWLDGDALDWDDWDDYIPLLEDIPPESPHSDINLDEAEEF